MLCIKKTNEMENLLKTIPVLATIGKNAYFCGMEKEKEIKWLFPEADTEVSIEDYQKKIFEDEHSGDMSFKEFRERLEAWSAKVN